MTAPLGTSAAIGWPPTIRGAVDVAPASWLDRLAGRLEHWPAVRVLLTVASGAAAWALVTVLHSLGKDGLWGTPLKSLPDVAYLAALAGLAASLPQLVAGTRPRRLIQLGLSIAALVAIGDVASALVLVAASLGISLVARSGMRVRWQLLVVCLGWSTYPLLRWHGLLPSWLEHGSMFMLWATLAFSSLWVIIQRARGELLGIADEMFYFLALPRAASVFFAPLSPRAMFGNESPRTLRPLLGGIGLGLYALALGRLASGLLLWRPPQFDDPWRVAADFVIQYCFATQHLFVGMALLRLFGFGVPAGFRWPFLSQSFQQFFASWNHFVRDAIFELFLLPIQGWLRQRFESRRAVRVIALYTAIFLGSFVLNDLLVPLATSVSSNHSSLAHSSSMLHLVLLGLFWTAIIWPRELFGTTAYAGWQGAWRVVRFNIMYFALWYGFRWADWAGY
jgi:hypothetical protein